MRAISVAALALALSGCALFGGKRHGSYAVVAPPSQTQAIVADSLVELVKLYPPAISRLSIDRKSAADAFGRELVDGLRKRGYAVVEASGKGKANSSALPLRYVMDEPMTGFYRVMLRVGNQSLTRGYAVSQAGVSPAAGWAVNLSGASPELVERAMRPDLPIEPERVQVDMAAIGADAGAPGEPGAAYKRSGRSRPRTVSSSWRVQFAAFQTERAARQHWRSLVSRSPALAAMQPRFTRSARGMTFVQAGSYRTVASAKRLCSKVKTNACIVVKA